MGGSAREWSATLPADLVSGSEIEIRLVMTKFGGPNVDVQFDVVLEK
ncbi:MAG: hypothetical protein ACE5HT_16295 [Gemmatimonadales bacterium]